MVRFKNRWFLVEFLFPSSQVAPASAAPSSLPTAEPPSSTSSLSTAAGKRRGSPGQPLSSKRKKARPVSTSTRAADATEGSSDSDQQGEDDADSSDDEGENSPKWPLTGTLPLLLPPPPNAITGKAKRLDEKSVYQALKASIVTCFGDDGWGRIGSSTSVKYYSPHTSLCIIRTSREQYRTVWAALSMLGVVNGERCIARVVHCSGTIKKIQNAAITYNRNLVATVLESIGEPRTTPKDSEDKTTPVFASPEGEGGWKGWAEREAATIGGLTD